MVCSKLHKDDPELLWMINQKENNLSDLEGTERGYVVWMDEANRITSAEGYLDPRMEFRAAKAAKPAAEMEPSKFEKVKGGRPQGKLVEPVGPKVPESRDTLIAALKAKGFDGTVDRLQRGLIDEVQARGELEGTRKSQLRPPSETQPNPADVAAELKGVGIGRQESWSRWVQRTSLKPGMDAKDWYRIYDSVTPTEPKAKQEGQETSGRKSSGTLVTATGRDPDKAAAFQADIAEGENS